MSNLFPDQTCVIACSGPSLNKVDCFSLGLPVVVISTAIRSLKRGDYWILADYLNEMHGKEGKDAWEEPSIIKVIPKNRANLKRIEAKQHFMVVDVRESNLATDNLERDLFSPNLPYFRGPHKTITMAIQWAHSNGAKKLIFAGNDLHATSVETKYAYKSENHDLKKKHNFSKTLDQVAQCLRGWYPIAKSRGFEWYSWECGDIFSSMVPKFEPNMLEEIKKK
jgi:hypothetical protein